MLMAYDREQIVSEDFLMQTSDLLQVQCMLMDSCKPFKQPNFTLKVKKKIKFMFKQKR